MKNIVGDGSSSNQSPTTLIKTLNPSQLKLLERIKDTLSTNNNESETNNSDLKSIEFGGFGGGSGSGSGLDSLSSDLIVLAQDSPVEDLHMGGVVNEILNLILRLEYQRRRAETMLINERFIQNKLKSEIESLALRKARELPARVQAEHDACVTDITELNWHISFNQKTERKLSRRCDLADKLYHQLNERVTNIREMTPQIEEKCKFETELRKRIDQTQRDIDEMLAKTRDRLRDTEDKLAEANQRAAKEREAYEADLNACRWELSKAK